MVESFGHELGPFTPLNQRVLGEGAQALVPEAPFRSSLLYLTPTFQTGVLWFLE